MYNKMGFKTGGLDMSNEKKKVDEKIIESILGKNYNSEDREKLIDFLETNDVDFDKENVYMNIFGDWVVM